MPQSPHRCQHISRSRWPRSRRFGIFPIAGMIVLGLSCLGCWQEVRYEPDKTAQPAPKVAAVEAAVSIPESLPVATPEELVGGTELEVLEEPVGGVVANGLADPSAEANSPGVERSGLAAWRMSSGWSMAAALQAKGRGVESFGGRIEQAGEEAKVLGVELPELPSHEEGADRLSRNLTFLLEVAGPRLASELGELHGADHAALAELAIKTHVLLLSYTPSSTRLEPVIVAIRQAAESSGLPESVWRELIDLLAARAEFKEVKAAIYQLHQRATDFLSD